MLVRIVWRASNWWAVWYWLLTIDLLETPGLEDAGWTDYFLECPNLLLEECQTDTVKCNNSYLSSSLSLFSQLHLWVGAASLSI
jgi:hypothetical protein